MPSTTNWSLPYPGPNDAPNGPSAVSALADAVDSALESKKTLFARKTGDLSRASTATAADDPDLQVTVAASGVYRLDVGLFFVAASTTAGDFKAQFAAPTGATVMASGITFAAASSAATDDITTCITLTTWMSCGVVHTGDPFNPCKIDGLLVVGGTGGLFKVQWSQNASNVTPTTLKANSYLRLVRLA